MVSPSRPLEIFVVPFVVPSHMMPTFQMARLFAARGHRITVVTIPTIASAIQKTIDADTALGRHISVHLVHRPPSEVGLPLEKLCSVTDMETGAKLFREFCLLRPQIEEFLLAGRPDCIISEMSYQWIPDIAAQLGVPHLLFHESSVFTPCIVDALQHPDSPHWTIQSDSEPFVVPGLPDPITITRSQLHFSEKYRARADQRRKEWTDTAVVKSYGILVGGFDELEPEYLKHYHKVTEAKIFNLGPMALYNLSSQNKGEKAYQSAVGESEFVDWLNSKKPSSVVYACFGSTCTFPDEQLMEMARGLEDSGHNFIWVVHGKNDKDEENDRKWLPDNFEERVKDRGMIVRGWAPQFMILDHQSVGGFLTHCGWSSVMEGVSAGVPLITWPVHSEQFYNEKLVCQVLRVGVEVGAEEWSLFPGKAKSLIKGEKIAKAVRRVLDGGDEAVVAMREKMKELSEMARRAVEEGGSSHRNLTVLIDSLLKMRDQKA